MASGACGLPTRSCRLKPVAGQAKYQGLLRWCLQACLPQPWLWAAAPAVAAVAPVGPFPAAGARPSGPVHSQSASYERLGMPKVSSFGSIPRAFSEQQLRKAQAGGEASHMHSCPWLSSLEV